MSALPARLPRYVLNLNTWAESFGLRTEMTVEPYTNTPEERLWGKWSGTRAQLMELVKPAPSYRLPLKRGQVVVPKGLHSARGSSLLAGEVSFAGDQAMLEIDFGSPAFTLSSNNGIETLIYEEEVFQCLGGGPAVAADCRSCDDTGDLKFGMKALKTSTLIIIARPHQV